MRDRVPGRPTDGEFVEFATAEAGRLRRAAVIDMQATDYGQIDGVFHQDDTIVMTFDQLAAAASDPRWGFSMDAAFVAGAADLPVQPPFIAGVGVSRLPH